jgi:OmpA-OmpF porin, OOP family
MAQNCASKDSDGDGIADFKDKCDKTPPNVPVDLLGCPKDTDGDGILDYLDKQIITPTECQPVDENGVGACPNNCGKGANIAPPYYYNQLKFIGVNLTKQHKLQLDELRAWMRNNPSVIIHINSYCNNNFSKVSITQANTRAKLIIDYLLHLNDIDKDRILLKPIVSKINDVVLITNLR